MNKAKRIKAALFAAVLLASIAPCAHAQDSETSKELQVCMDAVDHGGMKKSQWGACYSAELTRQDQRLNETYRLLQSKVSVESRAALVKAQRAWMAFRDGWCGYEATIEWAPGGEVNRLTCMVDQTSIQERRLRESIL